MRTAAWRTGCERERLNMSEMSEERLAEIRLRHEEFLAGREGDFVAHARFDLPDLVAALEAAWADRRRLEAAIRATRGLELWDATGLPYASLFPVAGDTRWFWRLYDSTGPVYADGPLVALEAIEAAPHE